MNDSWNLDPFPARCDGNLGEGNEDRRLIPCTHGEVAFEGQRWVA